MFKLCHVVKQALEMKSVNLSMTVRYQVTRLSDY